MTAGMVIDMQLLRSAYDGLGDLKDFKFPAGMKVDVYIDNPGDPDTDTVIDSSPLGVIRSHYVIRALVALVEANKVAVKNAVATEMEGDLAQIKTLAELP